MMVKYFDASKNDLYPSNFAKFIVDYYRSLAKTLGKSHILENQDAVVVDRKIGLDQGMGTRCNRL